MFKQNYTVPETKEELEKLVKIFNQSPEFERYQDITQMNSKCVKSLMNF